MRTFIASCGTCKRKFVWRTHEESGLVDIAIPGGESYTGRSLQKVVHAILALMIGHSQRDLTASTHAYPDYFTLSTAGRYLKIVSALVTSATQKLLHEQRVQFRDE